MVRKHENTGTNVFAHQRLLQAHSLATQPTDLGKTSLPELLPIRVHDGSRCDRTMLNQHKAAF